MQVLRNKALIIIFCLCPLLSGLSQSIQPDSEDLFYRFQNNSDNYEQVLQYYSEPLYLNQTSPEELRKLGVLSENQIAKFFEHLNLYGKLISIYELQSIKSFDFQTIQNLLPFVLLDKNTNSVTNRSLKERFLKSKNHILLLRYDRISSNLLGNNYLGSPYRLYIRYKNQIKNDFSLGFTLEKDIGEKLLSNQKNNFSLLDFQSFHLLKYNIGPFKKIIVGDYTLNIGQGLILGNGFFIGKSSQSILSVLKVTSGLRPYTATTESGFFRGIATNMSFKNINTIFFYSNQRLDKNRNISGLHRTISELNNKNKLKENLVGYHISYKNRWFSLGQTLTYVKLSDSLNLNSSNITNFQGRYLTNLGLNFFSIWQNVTLGTEWAINPVNKAITFKGSIILALSKYLDISLLYRNYSPFYTAFYARTFSERTSPNNEIGNYLGFRLKLSKQILFNGYIDIFRFPWLTTQASISSKGYDFLLRGQYKNKKHYFYFQYRFRHGQQDKNDPSNSALPLLENTYLGQIRLHLEFTNKPLLKWKTRIQISHNHINHSNLSYGYLLSQSLILKYKKLKINGTVHFFDTDNFNTRQFIYESDILYAFSFPSFNGLGSRLYTVISLKLNKYASLYFKYAKTFIISELPQESDEERNYWRCLLKVKF